MIILEKLFKVGDAINLIHLIFILYINSLNTNEQLTAPIF